MESLLKHFIIKEHGIRLCTPNAGALGLIPGSETGSLISQLKTPIATAKVSCLLQLRWKVLQLRPSAAK